MSLNRWREVLVNIIGDCTAVTALGPTSLLTNNATRGKWTFSNNFFEVGKMVRIYAAGRISCVVTTPGSGRFILLFNGATQLDSGAFALNVVAKTNVPWQLDVIGTCRTDGSGSSGTIMWQGHFISEAVVGAGTALATSTPHGVVNFTHGGISGAPVVGVGFDTTAALPLDMTWTQIVTTGSITMHQYMIEALN